MLAGKQAAIWNERIQIEAQFGPLFLFIILDFRPKFVWFQHWVPLFLDLNRGPWPPMCPIDAVKEDNERFWWIILLCCLLSHFSRVRLCVTPETAAYQAHSSLGFSRQEHWSGLPCPSPRLGKKKVAFCLSSFLPGVLLESIWYVFKMPTVWNCHHQRSWQDPILIIIWARLHPCLCWALICLSRINLPSPPFSSYHFILQLRLGLPGKKTNCFALVFKRLSFNLK